MLEIKKDKNKYFIGDSEDKPLAEMTYVVSGRDILIVDHTFVSDELGGQGVGKMLLKEVVDWARQENRKIIPLCPYAKAQMERNEEYQDVIHK